MAISIFLFRRINRCLWWYSETGILEIRTQILFLYTLLYIITLNSYVCTKLRASILTVYLTARIHFVWIYERYSSLFFLFRSIFHEAKKYLTAKKMHVTTTKRERGTLEWLRTWDFMFSSLFNWDIEWDILHRYDPLIPCDCGSSKVVYSKYYR